MSPPRELLTDLDLVEERLELGPWELTLLRPRQAEALLDEDAFEHEEFLPYWAELWKSGLALAEEVVAREVRGLRVVELGCGLGVPSLAASLAGAEVLATDWSPTAIALLEENARRNDVRLETAIVAWAHADALVQRAPWDLVLGAEHLEFMLERRLSCGHTITSMGQPKYDGSIRRRWTADEDQGSKSSRASGGLFILSARPLPNTALMKTPGAGFDRTASVCPFCGS